MGGKTNKMETQQDLDIGVGSKEMETLKPATVKIENTRIETVGEKGNKKVVCAVKHPDKEDTIKISSVKYEKNNKIVTTGLWFDKDSDGLIKKGSALAVLMNFVKANTLKELNGKELVTSQDDKGYLCFKAYWDLQL